MISFQFRLPGGKKKNIPGGDPQHPKIFTDCSVCHVRPGKQTGKDENNPFSKCYTHRPHSRQVTGARCTGGRGSPVSGYTHNSLHYYTVCIHGKTHPIYGWQNPQRAYFRTGAISQAYASLFSYSPGLVGEWRRVQGKRFSNVNRSFMNITLDIPE